ncbi:MAG TPA: BamA/TamA family outer membrane protein, partial [Thermoanaerobaculia bacterium]
LGDRRIFANISSVDTLSNFDITYADLSRRWFWYGRVFDFREYYLADDVIDQARGARGQLDYRVTGGVAAISYPFTFYQRAEIGLGYLLRKFSFPVFSRDPETGEEFIDLNYFEDDFPVLQGALVGDSTTFAYYGPVNGRRWRLGASWSPDLEASGTLASSVSLEARQYIQVTQRSNLAMRVFGGLSEGNRPNLFFFGGLDTIRGERFRSISGDRGFFANLEYRFPLIDLVATPVLAFQGIRGVLFVDAGGAWFNDIEDFEFYNSETDRLEDGILAYGWGVTARFLGFDLNWDFSKKYKPRLVAGEEEDDGFETVFWIGTRF